MGEGGEPRNAASEAVRALRDLLLDRARVDQWPAAFADGFVLQDRRKAIGFTELDKASYIGGLVSLSNDFDVAWSKVEVLAIRGDRLALSRVNECFKNGFEREYLGLLMIGDDVSQVERMVVFSPDDLDAAVTELDRLNTESADWASAPTHRGSDSLEHASRSSEEIRVRPQDRASGIHTQQLPTSRNPASHGRDAARS